MLADILKQRKRQSEKGGNREGFSDIFLFADSLAAVTEFPDDTLSGILMRLCREGLRYGIHVIVTENSVSGVGWRMLGLFPDRIAFFCSDRTDYTELFGRVETEPDSVPGSAIAKSGGKPVALQVFEAFHGPEIPDWIRKINRIYDGSAARRVPQAPVRLTTPYLRHLTGTIPADGRIPFAVTCSTVKPVFLDPGRTQQLLIAGPGKMTDAAAGGILQAVQTQYPGNRSAVWVFGRADGAMCLLSGRIQGIRRISNPDILPETLRSMRELQDQAEKQTQSLLQDQAEKQTPSLQQNQPGKKAPPLLQKQPGLQDRKDGFLCMVFCEEAMEYLSESEECMAHYNQLLKNRKRGTTLMIFLMETNRPVSYDAPQLLRRLRDDRQAVLCMPPEQFRLFDLPSVGRQEGKTAEEGDRWLLNGPDLTRIRILEP